MRTKTVVLTNVAQPELLQSMASLTSESCRGMLVRSGWAVTIFKSKWVATATHIDLESHLQQALKFTPTGGYFNVIEVVIAVFFFTGAFCQ